MAPLFCLLCKCLIVDNFSTYMSLRRNIFARKPFEAHGALSGLVFLQDQG